MFSKADAVLCALGKSERGARTAARWCAARQAQASQTACSGQCEALPDCTDQPADPFEALREAAALEQDPFELEAHLGDCISSGASHGEAEQLSGEPS